jgi:hypothetical protein
MECYLGTIIPLSTRWPKEKVQKDTSNPNPTKNWGCNICQQIADDNDKSNSNNLVNVVEFNFRVI